MDRNALREQAQLKRAEALQAQKEPEAPKPIFGPPIKVNLGHLRCFAIIKILSSIYNLKRFLYYVSMSVLSSATYHRASRYGGVRTWVED